MAKSTASDMPVDIEVIHYLSTLADTDERFILGVTGAPGAGKSMLTTLLKKYFGARVETLPMDGFHLSQRQLKRLGRSERKGSPDTFDSAGYQALLRRIRQTTDSGETVYAPEFDRDTEEPNAASLAIDPDVSLIVTEGNYLLLDDPDWRGVSGELNEVWYLDVNTVLREQRLVARHQQFGASEAQAWAWLKQTDRSNADLIAQTVRRADRCLMNNGHKIGFVN